LMSSPWHACAWICGLAASIGLTFIAGCAFLNGRDAFVPNGSPTVPLFALGGIYGHARGTKEVLRETVLASLLGIAAIAVCDILYARHTEARYFALHVIVNLWISLLALPELFFVLSDPITAMSEVRTNHWPTSLVFSIHVYHMLFFRGLYFIDWLHHVLMVVVGAPLLVTAEVGPVMNFNNFFMCGVPGGADYAMLFAVKHGWMAPLAEKRYNSLINVWCRAPFLVCTATFCYLQFFLQPDVPLWIKSVRAFLIVLACWNGLFFMERVVGNSHVQMYKTKAAKREAQDRSSNVYEHDEHVTPTFPGMGMRVALSKQDLASLDKVGSKDS